MLYVILVLNDYDPNSTLNILDFPDTWIFPLLFTKL